MSSIHVLTSEIINQIAAGEVVERPAHLVKELVENSLDAGSDQIFVEVSEGGRNILVRDNGSGILSEDLAKALQRHATSKITKTDDLWNLHTFGFRGEALASAAAVSKMTLSSFEKNEKRAAQIYSHFGKISEVKPGAHSRGTEIKVEELFENTPARLKFLKTEVGEFSQIKLVIKALALAQPQVEFKLVCNGDLQLFYPKRTSHLERAGDVLEKKSLFETAGVFHGIKCRAVFSSPHEVAKTSKQIWVFVQNRWVQDRSLQAAVQDAYRSLLMHGEYPFAVLWVDCDPGEIDVNIHPTKSQVKFRDASNAFRAVQSTLRQALEKAPWIKNQENFPAAKIEDYGVSPIENLSFQDFGFQQTQFKSKNFDLGTADFENLRVVETDVAPVNQGFWSSLQVIGQANLTYIVCQRGDRLVFVDQHAAHERVVFESLMQSWRAGRFESQNYLFPLALDLSEEKVEALLAQESAINKMGFEIERLGPSCLGVKSAPALVKESGLPSVFDRLASEIVQNGGSFALEKSIGDIFASMACHSVVRAGQSLSLPEMSELLKSMDQFALSSFCPHGRPVSIENTFTDLEKRFGRIN